LCQTVTCRQVSAARRSLYKDRIWVRQSQGFLSLNPA
jgi:hypothetical protein